MAAWGDGFCRVDARDGWGWLRPWDRSFEWDEGGDGRRGCFFRMFFCIEATFMLTKPCGIHTTHDQDLMFFPVIEFCYRREVT
jgi:hypothetical protein